MYIDIYGSCYVHVWRSCYIHRYAEVVFPRGPKTSLRAFLYAPKEILFAPPLWKANPEHILIKSCLAKYGN